MENLTLSLADERILYAAIFRHVEHLSQLDWGSSDSISAANMAIEMFPKIGYPVPGWVSDLANGK
jgi:outer membrane protease